MTKYKHVEKEVIKLFKKKYSVESLSKKFFIKQSTIYYLLRKNEIIIPKGVHIKEEQLKKIKKDYKKGLSLDMLSQKYNVEKTRLCRILNSSGLSDTKKQMIIILHGKGNYRPSHIAQRLSITTEVVKKIIKDFGLEKRKDILKKVGITKNEILKIRDKITSDNI